MGGGCEGQGKGLNGEDSDRREKRGSPEKTHDSHVSDSHC